jgi:hypothetical protein
MQKGDGSTVVAYYEFDTKQPGVVAGQSLELRPSTIEGISQNRVQTNLSQYGSFVGIRHTDRLSYANGNGTIPSGVAQTLVADLTIIDDQGVVVGSLGNVVSSLTNNAYNQAPDTAAPIVSGNITVGGASLPPSSEPAPALGGGWYIPVVVTPSAVDIAAGVVYVVRITSGDNPQVQP